MRIRIPKYTWIHVVDENGGLISRTCTQEDTFVFTEDHKHGISDCENPTVYDTMAPVRERDGAKALG